MNDTLAALTIDIVSDVVCPWCYIGKRHLETALSEWRAKSAANATANVAIRWHPFQLNPDLPSEGIDRKSYLENKFGGPARAKEIYARVGAAGSAAGLQLNFDAIQKQPNTLAAHALIDFAQNASDADAGVANAADRAAIVDRVVESLFNAYFILGRFIGDVEVLSQIAGMKGLDRERVRATLADAFALDRIASMDANVRAQGVSGVPFFVFNQKYALSGAQPAQTMIEAIERSLND
jgi:predicted DsbA family dithiol-disulfide isomerase